jgi:hypothetical protein
MYVLCGGCFIVSFLSTDDAFKHEDGWRNEHDNKGMWQI